jgi:hypothetical protein
MAAIFAFDFKDAKRSRPWPLPRQLKIACGVLTGLLVTTPAFADSFLFGTSDDCISTTQSVFEASDPAAALPSDRAIIRVGYWGDPGTPERIGAVANPVQWNVGLLSGVLAAPTEQRGYADFGPPVATSAVQARCGEAGVVLNSYQFSHTKPVAGGGPQMGFGEKRSLPMPLFSSNRYPQALSIRARIKHPQHDWNEDGAVGQIVLVYYLQPLRCPELFPNQLCPAASFGNRVPAFAHVIGLYDSRPADAATGVGNEHLLHDGFTTFFASPLAEMQADGTPVRLLQVHASSALATNADVTWNEYRDFRADISRSRLQKMLNIFRSKAAACPQFTVDDPACLVRATPPNIEDWGIVLVSALVEVFPAALPQCVRSANAPGCLNISMGVGIRNVDAWVVDEVAPQVMQASLKLNAPAAPAASPSSPD